MKTRTSITPLVGLAGGSLILLAGCMTQFIDDVAVFADLAGADLAVPDISPPSRDLSPATDQSQSTPADMTPAVDARVPHDLTAPPDLATPDLSTLRDLSAALGCTVAGGCAANEYCHFTNAPCGSNGKPGVCMPRPFVCPLVIIPVCGCDGKTYNNECEGNRSGQDKLHNGMCP